jgi:hypothetical protein
MIVLFERGGAKAEVEADVDYEAVCAGTLMLFVAGAAVTIR